MDDPSKPGGWPPYLAHMGDGSALARLREEWCALQERLNALDHLLRDCADRQRFATRPDDAARAAAEERRHLEELDRLMTRARAVEGQLLLQRRCLH